MIPSQMEEYLRERLPRSTWENRLIKDNGKCFLEFNTLDVDRLARLEIEVDSLGPRLVVCMWDEESPYEIGGYLVIDNLAMGQPAMGGIRMLTDVTPSVIHNLARGMTLKNAAADLPYGGGKSGIVADPNTSPKIRHEIIRGFARLINRYKKIYLPGPDVGTLDADMKTIAIENGLDEALSKPVEMGGNRIDELGAAAGGTIIALQALLEEIPRLMVLPQFANLVIPERDQLNVLIQGFGAVGANAARILDKRLPEARVIGISDITGYLFCLDGLPISRLYELWEKYGPVAHHYFMEVLSLQNNSDSFIKFSNSPDDLLRESAFCLIPASPIANYLDVDESSRPSMTVKCMGDWSVIIEGANTYSPIKSRLTARERMEREVYRRRGVLIATDYLVNSGGVIYAAQEHLVKTPSHLRIPDAMLGNREAVNTWLSENVDEFKTLAAKRRNAAQAYREEVIRRNMRELVDLLVSDADMLPCEAAEKISIRRVAMRESDRTASDIMTPIPTIDESQTIRSAAAMLVDSKCPILAVVSSEDDLVGVITEWDITRSTAQGNPNTLSLEKIMSREVITALPKDTILEVIRKLEHHEISAMPVVDQGCVLGMVSSDMLARRSLLRLLQTQT